MANYADIIAKIRELSFDRFITPSFFIRARSNATDVTITIATDRLTITKGTTTKDYLYTTYPTLDTLINALMSDTNVEAIYAGSFIPSEPTTSLFAKASTNLSTYVPVFRVYYFSTTFIEKWFKEYLRLIINAPIAKYSNATTQDFTDGFADTVAFDYNREMHMCLWVAYQLVGDRRLYELASQNLIQSTLGGNPDQLQNLDIIDASSFSLTGPGSDIQVQVGDVFTLNEDKNTELGIYNSGEIPKDMVPPWGVGSDNNLMDYYSFWYRLQLWLRDRLEMQCGDYSLRKDTVLNGRVSLDPRSSNKFYSYFDSYPWVFSPYLRGVPNVDIMNLRT